MDFGAAKLDRRTLLTGAGAAALAPAAAQAAYVPSEATAENVATALARFRSSIPSNFDRDYVEYAVVPFFLSSIYQGERPMLPMIDVPLSKENAIPFDFWGLLTKDWKPTPEEGVTVFLQGLEKRGPDNLRKRIYFSGVTPDLYGPKYQKKVVAFFDQLLDPKFAGKPMMRHYLDYYFDLYWDLHLGVKGDADSSRGAADRRKLQHRARLSQSDAADRLRTLHEGAQAARSAQGVDRREGQGSGKRTHPRSRQDDGLVLAQERRERRPFRP